LIIVLGWLRSSKFIDVPVQRTATYCLVIIFNRHRRAFHCSWVSFFCAFFIWFSITPLQSEIQTSLGLSATDLWTASIVGVGGTIFMRFLLGPLCDKYGSRILMSAVLCVAAIPTAMTGLVNSAAGLAVLRLFIGIAGGSFVMCQYWTTRFFTKDIVGTANAIVGGWVRPCRISSIVRTDSIAPSSAHDELLSFS
jgi:MFS transporter, NNP family, nitrate/nitrite transporter